MLKAQFPFKNEIAGNPSMLRHTPAIEIDGATFATSPCLFLVIVGRK